MNSATQIAPKAPPRRSQRGEPPWEIALLFPEQGSWSEADYLALNTNQLVELSDGCLEVLPMPTRLHQRIVKLLHRLLDEFVNEGALGEVFFAPLSVRLWSGKFRQPDVIFLRPDRASGDPLAPVEGADLVMEVVSAGSENRKRDLEIKSGEYAAAGIQEYWIVDPEQHTIKVLVLDGESYRLHGEFGVDDTATSVLLPGFAVKVADVFAAGEGRI